MSSSCRIAIVGGGLAGLATANALATVGIEADVFEAAAALGEIGASVNTSPQAVKALQAIGVGEKIAAVGHLSPGTYTRNMQTGEFLQFNDRREGAKRYGAPYYSFHRADLLDTLASGLDRNSVHLGHRLTAIEELSDRTVLSFANGARVDAEFLIGADGVRSVIRHALYGADNPTYTGQMVWRALLNATDVPSDDGIDTKTSALVIASRSASSDMKPRNSTRPGDAAARRCSAAVSEPPCATTSFAAAFERATCA